MLPQHVHISFVPHIQENPIGALCVSLSPDDSVNQPERNNPGGIYARFAMVYWLRDDAFNFALRCGMVICVLSAN